MDVVAWSILIFVARVVDVSLGTIRVQLIVRRKKLLAALIGFVEVLIFILIVSRVISDIQQLPYVLAYAGGFATGTLVGMHLSDRFSRRAVQVTFICNGSHDLVEAAVRKVGFALTSYNGRGRDGSVDVLEVICSSQELAYVIKIATEIDSSIFVYTQDLAGLKGGFVYGLKGKI